MRAIGLWASWPLETGAEFWDYHGTMKAISFGAVLWDVIEGGEHIGGAPFNLAAHLAQMGCAAWMISRVGADGRGAGALAEMRRLGVKPDFVQQDAAYPTGWVDVALSAGGQPTYTIHDNVAFDFIEAQPDFLKAVVKQPVDAFCFGTLEQRAPTTRKTLFRLLDVVPAKHFFYDVNVRQHYYSERLVRDSLIHSTIVKLNDSEVDQLGQTLYGAALAEPEFVARLQKQYPRVRIVCVTKGERGCTVYWDGQAGDCPGVRVQVVDTVGAGDAFSAAFLFKYCSGSSPFESARLANQIGAFVASQRGAVPAYTPEISALIAGAAPS